MSDIVIQAEGLGKKYLIGHQTERERYTALRDVLARNVRDYWRKAKALVHGEPIVQGDEQEEIWALREVNFEIRRGETVGIIGRNGAGKSTLLKILSRITEPSAGRVTIKGRVASLLEVGTGFHPELTGRENIYLNGAILGMTRAEIRRKFDEIVAFAEVEKFLDTPVKRYSSGMYVRLAFAVAAHLEPEILIVDEVLAVGDAAFQQKCLGKMGEVAKGGRTVIFVSHNMPAISNLSLFCIWLERGRFLAGGESVKIVQRYLSTDICSNVAELRYHQNRICNGCPVLNRISIHGDNNKPLVCGAPAVIDIEFDSQSIGLAPEVAFTIETLLGQRVFSFATYWTKRTREMDFSSGVASCRINNFPLIPGIYSMNIAIGTTANPFQDHIPNAFQFEVFPTDYYGTGKIPSSHHGVVFLDATWHS